MKKIITRENITDSDILETMIGYGGGFTCALAKAFQRADKENYARLKGAFPELLENYKNMTLNIAVEKAQRDGNSAALIV